VRTVAWKEEETKKKKESATSVSYIPFLFFPIYLNVQLYLPETRDSPLLETLAQGEVFGMGDTGFAALSCSKKRVDAQQPSSPPPQVSLNDLTASTSTLESSVDI